MGTKILNSVISIGCVLCVFLHHYRLVMKVDYGDSDLWFYDFHCVLSPSNTGRFGDWDVKFCDFDWLCIVCVFQQELMKETCKKSRNQEEKRLGLVIVRAWYGRIAEDNIK